MLEQFAQPLVRLPQSLPHTATIDRYPQRQRVDEQAHRLIGTGSGLHPTKQHRPEHHLFAARQPREHLAPRQMTHTRQHSPPPQRALARSSSDSCAGNSSRASGNPSLHLPAHPADQTAPSAPRSPPASLGRTPRAARDAHPTRTRYKIAERHQLPQPILLSQQMRLHFSEHHLQRRVVRHQVMAQQQQQPATVLTDQSQ